MKLLLVADLHYTLRQWDWLTATAGEFDLVILAGDLLDLGSIVPLETQIVVIRKYLRQLDQTCPTLVTSGNHDLITPEQESNKTAEWLQQERRDHLHVDGDYYEQDSLFFSLLPWWESPEDITLIETQLASQARLATRKRWIWIYHPPPIKSKTAWNGRADWGDQHLPRWISRYSPELVLGGHIHQAPFVRGGSWIDTLDSTFLFNGGRQPGSIPTFTVIDTDQNHAIWISAEDAQQASLSHPLHPLAYQG